MTDRAALDKLIAAVEAGECCTIPTPNRSATQLEPDRTARIMGYVESYVVLRHIAAMPWIETRKDVLAHLRAKLAELPE